MQIAKCIHKGMTPTQFIVRKLLNSRKKDYNEREQYINISTPSMPVVELVPA